MNVPLSHQIVFFRAVTQSFEYLRKMMLWVGGGDRAIRPSVHLLSGVPERETELWEAGYMAGWVVKTNKQTKLYQNTSNIQKSRKNSTMTTRKSTLGPTVGNILPCVPRPLL